jgi:hypothetical protein
MKKTERLDLNTAKTNQKLVWEGGEETKGPALRLVRRATPGGALPHPSLLAATAPLSHYHAALPDARPPTVQRKRISTKHTHTTVSDPGFATAAASKPNFNTLPNPRGVSKCYFHYNMFFILIKIKLLQI